jgi:hypothetical protein
MTSPSLVATNDQIVDHNLNVLFSESIDSTEVVDLNSRADSLLKLAEIYLAENNVGCYRGEDLQNDGHAIRLMLGRFQRDAFGTGRFFARLEQLEQSGKLDPATKKEIREKVLSLGLRIASESPRKTRIAAAFSLWMATFRPFYLRFYGDVKKDAIADKFCAGLNFWISSLYLKKFGDVIVGNSRNHSELIKRIMHDFTFREINMSSLEVLYCSIFKPREDKSKMSGEGT